MISIRIPLRVASAAVVGVAVFALGAPAATAGPMSQFLLPAAGMDPIPCDTRTYEFTGGDFLVVASDPSVAAHITARHVTATDGTSNYRVVGTETYSDTMGHLTAKISFVSQTGGKVDSINAVLRYYPHDADTVHVALDFGTCHYW